MMSNLDLEEGQEVQLKLKELPVATSLVLQPLKWTFSEIATPKIASEAATRGRGEAEVAAAGRTFLAPVRSLTRAFIWRICMHVRDGQVGACARLLHRVDCRRHDQHPSGPPLARAHGRGLQAGHETSRAEECGVRRRSKLGGEHTTRAEKGACGRVAMSRRLMRTLFFRLLGRLPPFSRGRA